jgi:hypothetical protein
MKDYFIWFLILFVAVAGCIVSWKYGFAAGAASVPPKYAVCENGTCVLSDKAPDYPGFKEK